MRLSKKIYLSFEKLRLKKKKIRIGSNTDFWRTIFLNFNKIGNNTLFSYSEIGRMSYIGNNCILNKAKVGDFCSIGSNVTVVYGDHPVDSFFSTHPSFYSTKSQSGLSFVKNEMYNENKTINGYSVIIENDVWIGSNVTILEGVTIKSGAVIATGAVVVKDVLEYEVVGGVPAKLLKKRFPEKNIEYLIESRWWEHSIDWFCKEGNIEYLQSLIGESNEKNS